MNIIRVSAVVLAIGFPLLVSAGSETRQYCDEMYPADSYDAEDRSQYIQECLLAYGDADSSAPEENEAVDDASYEAVDDASYYEGTVEEYIGEQEQEDVSEYESE